VSEPSRPAVAAAPAPRGTEPRAPAGSPPGSAVRARGLEVVLGGRRVLGPLDLDVESGESLLLIGPSGSGKTTLLRAIAGLCVPSAGTLELHGQPASAPGRLVLPPERRSVGLLFQGAALWPHMTALRTLTFTLGFRGVKGAAAKERARELLAKVRLEGLEERRPAELSGGEKQRLALARALASGARLMLLDEPLGPLDATLRTSLLATLSELHRELGWTTIHVTHDPHEAAAVATRIVTLRAGRLSEEGA